MKARIGLLAAMLTGFAPLLAAATVEPVYKVLPGRLPVLPGQTRLPSGGRDLAPVPNYDLDAPRDRADGRARVEAGVIDRDGRRRPDLGEFATGSGFSQLLERKSRSQSGLGSILAPSVILRVPLN